MKPTEKSWISKNRLFRAIIFSAVLFSCLGGVAYAENPALRRMCSMPIRSGGDYGIDWFSNVDVNGTVGVAAVCFPQGDDMRTLNALVTQVIREESEVPQVQIRFSGGRQRYYMDAGSLVRVRLQSVEYTIEQTSACLKQLLRQLIRDGVHPNSLVVLLLKDFQKELLRFLDEVEVVRNENIQARQNFFERFCHFYRNAFCPFLTWVGGQDFHRDHFHDEFWTLNIIEAIDSDIVLCPYDYPGGADAWKALSERIEATLRGQYLPFSPYYLAQWRICRLRAHFLIRDLEEERAPGYRETVQWIKDELDGDLSLAVYLSRSDWASRAVRDINTVYDAWLVRAQREGFTVLSDTDVEMHVVADRMDLSQVDVAWALVSLFPSVSPLLL